MNNIYNLKVELLDIFSELEENGGELTPELEEQLAITQQDFNNKIKSYTEVIKLLKADCSSIDEEVKRLRELKVSKQNTIDRITKIVIEAISLFGDTNKSGVKYIDYGTGKVSIRRSKSVEVDEHKVNVITDSFKSIISALIFNNQLKVVDGIDENLLEVTAKDNKEFISGEEISVPVEFTKEDLNAFDGKISFKANFGKLLNGDYFKALKAIVENIGTPEIEASISKADIKTSLSEENSNITIGNIVENKSLTIK